MGTMKERLRHALKARGLTPVELIAKTGLSKGTVYFLLDGTTGQEKVRAETIARICKALRISKDWLLHGRGDMDDAPHDDQEWRDVLGYTQAVGLGTGAEADEYAEAHKLKFRAASFKRKGLHPDKVAVFYGKGESMLPRIRPGDAILFDTADTKPVDGAIYVILWRGEYYAKRALLLDDSVYFTTDNPSGDHQWNKPKRMDAKRESIQVIGRVRWIGSWED
jgi:phage repressor protein C with HTH and peptisase S24 domain